MKGVFDNLQTLGQKGIGIFERLGRASLLFTHILLSAWLPDACWGRFFWRGWDRIRSDNEAGKPRLFEIVILYLLIFKFFSLLLLPLNELLFNFPKKYIPCVTLILANPSIGIKRTKI